MNLFLHILDKAWSLRKIEFGATGWCQPSIHSHCLNFTTEAQSKEHMVLQHSKQIDKRKHLESNTMAARCGRSLPCWVCQLIAASAFNDLFKLLQPKPGNTFAIFGFSQTEMSFRVWKIFSQESCAKCLNFAALRSRASNVWTFISFPGFLPFCLPGSGLRSLDWELRPSCGVSFLLSFNAVWTSVSFLHSVSFTVRTLCFLLLAKN